jgi:hypothetical protein
VTSVRGFTRIALGLDSRGAGGIRISRTVARAVILVLRSCLEETWMAVDQIALGSWYYLFKKRGSTNDVAMITAHGGVGGSSDTFVAPIEIGFYQHAGSALGATRDIALYPPTEWAHKGSTCDEHYLSKFQGKHGGGFETYQDLKRWVEEHDIAALTVRHRTSWFVSKHQPRLSEAARLLSGNGYTQVRCSFCRVFAVRQYVKVM